MNRLRAALLGAATASVLAACGVQAEDTPVTITTGTTSTETPSLQTSVCPPSAPTDRGSTDATGRSAAAAVVTPVGCAPGSATPDADDPVTTPSATPSS